jgi:predicted RNase H-like nuclease (RuvC/YqgF family)
MENELEKALNEDKEKDTPPASQPPAKTEEEVKKEEQLANLNKAVQEAELKLQTLRTDAKKVKKGIGEEEDDLPDISKTIEEDPTAKAFDRRQDRKIQPLRDEAESAKSEVRGYALRQFLASNPALARNTSKVKEMMEFYDKAHTCTERTTEGVLLDLRRAAGAVFADELLQMAQTGRQQMAEADAAFSSPAIDNGATGYRNQQQPGTKKLSSEEKTMLAKWGIPEDEWQKEAKEYAPK